MTTPEASHVLARAACIGEDPRMFDATDMVRAAHALAVCRRCPIPSACLAAVRPQRSHFDGVCGSAVWSNGRLIGRMIGARAS